MVNQDNISELANDPNPEKRRYAAYVFRYFKDFPDKDEAWDDLHRLTQDDNIVVRQNATFAFQTSFSAFPDKAKAWDDLHRLTLDDDSIVRQNATVAFDSFSAFPDKDVAWDDLHRLTQDDDSIIRQNAARAFVSFSAFPDKAKAWDDLHRLTQDDDSIIRQNAARAFVSFSAFPDKAKAWDDLHRLTQDDDSIVRQNAARAFVSFSAFPDKAKAWDDLHRLTQDDEGVVRQNAAIAFVSFSAFPDKDIAWDDLHRLTQDGNSVVRQNAAIAFLSLSSFPDKKVAWDDLHLLVQDKSNAVRQNAAFCLNRVYEKLSKKENILELLNELIEDNSGGVRAAAYYSLARIYVYESSETDDKQLFDENYAKAMQFFEKAYASAPWISINFCFTIHGLFHKIINGDIKTVDEIQDNVSKLKNNTGSSEERQNLLKVLESLGDILEESLIAKEHGEDARKYQEKILPFCDKADDLIKSLKHEGIRGIATKAKEQVEDEYLKTIGVLYNKINTLIDKPELWGENVEDDEIIPLVRDYCELINEPDVRERYKMEIQQVKKEKNPYTRRKLALQMLKDLKFIIEISSKQKDIELENKDKILEVKDKESRKGFDFLKMIHPNEITDRVNISKVKTIQFFDFAAIIIGIFDTVLWGAIYPKLNEMLYPTALRECLIITVITIVFLIVLYKRR